MLDGRPDPDPSRAVAIVGLGGSGVAAYLRLVDRILESDRPPHTVYLFEKQDFVGGLAYDPAVRGVRVNLPASAMVVDDRDPGRFAAWLARRGIGSTYPERRLFGEFLEEELRRAEERLARGGHATRRLRSEVLDIAPDPAGGGTYRLTTADGRTVTARHCVIATGNIPRRPDPATAHAPRLAELARDHRAGPEGRTIAVVGTGLSALDVVAWAGQRGGAVRRILMFSRGGRIPTVQAAAGDCGPLEELTEPNVGRAAGRDDLGGLYRLFLRELRRRGAGFPRRRLLDQRDTAGWLEAQIEAARGGVAWQSVLGAVYGSGAADRIWLRLDGRARARLLGDAYSSWVALRHSMPLHAAEGLLRLMRAGEVVVGGGFERVEPVPGGTFRVHAGGRCYAADLVVDARGPARFGFEDSSPLFRNMLGRGLIRPCAEGGIQVDPGSCRVVGEGPRGEIFALGPPTCGVFFSQNAMIHGAWKAARIARELALVPRAVPRSAPPRAVPARPGRGDPHPVRRRPRAAAEVAAAG
jgi:uncharacterized NAD(P)/FAD-binding protein YdhS